LSSKPQTTFKAFLLRHNRNIGFKLATSSRWLWKVPSRSMEYFLLFIFLLWPCASCSSSFGLVCTRCSAPPCQINVGLLGNLASVDEGDVYEAISMINSATALHPEWEIQM